MGSDDATALRQCGCPHRHRPLRLPCSEPSARVPLGPACCSGLTKRLEDRRRVPPFAGPVRSNSREKAARHHWRLPLAADVQLVGRSPLASRARQRAVGQGTRVHVQRRPGFSRLGAQLGLSRAVLRVLEQYGRILRCPVRCASTILIHPFERRSLCGCNAASPDAFSMCFAVRLPCARRLNRRRSEFGIPRSSSLFATSLQTVVGEADVVVKLAALESSCRERVAKCQRIELRSGAYRCGQRDTRGSTRLSTSSSAATQRPAWRGHEPCEPWHGNMTCPPRGWIPRELGEPPRSRRSFVRTSVLCT